MKQKKARRQEGDEFNSRPKWQISLMQQNRMAAAVAFTRKGLGTIQILLVRSPAQRNRENMMKTIKFHYIK